MDQRSATVRAILDELVAAVEERDLGDPDAGEWIVDARIRRLERKLVAVYRTTERPPIVVIGRSADETEEIRTHRVAP